MISFKPKFFSIIFIGRQNPQILNHDFLVKNNIIPIEKEPFKSIAAKSPEANPFDQFVATPVVSNIIYKNIAIAIEENRFQITDNATIDPLKSLICDIIKKYFSILRYTPLTLGGINFNGIATFETRNEKLSFEDKFIAERNGIYKKIGINDFEISLKLKFPFNQNQAELAINQLKGNELTKAINFNYEFGFKDIDSFLHNIEETPIIFEKFNDILKKLEIAC